MKTKNTVMRSSPQEAEEIKLNMNTGGGDSEGMWKQFSKFL